jgi:hypothetical protein
MIPGKYDLNLYRGDTYHWQFKLWQDAAQTVPFDLAGATADSEIRDKPGGTNIVVLDCVITQPNIVDVILSAAKSANVPLSGSWDLQLTLASGDVRTPIAGTVKATADVTGGTGTRRELRSA